MRDTADVEMERLGYSPHFIMLRRVESYLMERANGGSGAQALRGLMASVSTKRDAYYDTDLTRIRDSNDSDKGWLVFEAILRLLRRHGIWDLKGRREVPRGEILAQSIE